MRDAVLSDEPRVLRVLDRVEADPQPAPRRSSPETSRDVVTTERVVTVETAGTWLIAQSTALRAALAQGLAGEIAAVQERARLEGVESGRVQGLRESTERVESSLTALSRLAQAAESAFEQEAAHLAQTCADIVSEVFLKIAGEHLASREATLGVVLQVLKRVKDERELTIRVSSQDLPLLQEHEAHIQHVLGARRWTLVSDSRVSAGGCLVESALGTLDGRLEVQLRELCETITAAKAARWTQL